MDTQFGVTQTSAPTKLRCDGTESAAPRSVAREAEHEAVAALREIEFDRETGKLSDADYAELRTRYTEEALVAMRAGAVPADADPAEAIILAARARLSPSFGPLVIERR